MTSNVGVKKLQDFGGGLGFNTKTLEKNKDNQVESILKKELKKQFPPEFLNRLDDIVIFDYLKVEEIRQIVNLEIDKLKLRMMELGYSLKLTKSIKDYLVTVGHEEEYGARPLNRAIQKHVEDPISEEVLKGNVKKGETIVLSYSKVKDKVEVRVAE